MIKKSIEKAVYELCIQANTQLPEYVFEKLLSEYKKTNNPELATILINAQMAFDKKMPLCQDTGQVLVFIKSSPKLLPADINNIVNKAIEKSYKENYYRNSVVNDAFERINTKTNTPAIIYTEIADINEIQIDLMIKGAGSENISKIEMLSPTSDENEIRDFIVRTIKSAGTRGCPPYFVGVGIGGTIDYAAILSKKALILNNDKKSDLEKDVIRLCENVSDINILTDFTHIACMPIAITINCHSKRVAKCKIDKNGQISFVKRNLPTAEIKEDLSDAIKINTDEIEKLKDLKVGQKVMLSGEIYTARDMAHKRLAKMIEQSEKLPFDLKNKIIFYAAPCPERSDKQTNSIGPTTASRMDKYAQILYDNGIIATIGKGERSKDIKGLYFTAQGGVACYLCQHIIKNEVIAFADLTPEAICRLEVKDLPLRVFSV